MPKIMRKQVKTRYRLADQQYEILLREDAEEMTKELLELVMGGPQDLPDTKDYGKEQKKEKSTYVWFTAGKEYTMEDYTVDLQASYEGWAEELKMVAEALVLKRLLIAAGG